jgi:hypothetical protein
MIFLFDFESELHDLLQLTMGWTEFHCTSPYFAGNAMARPMWSQMCPASVGNGESVRPLRSRRECIRPGAPLSPEDARRLVKGYVEHYNNVRLNSAIGYIRPKDMLAGNQHEIQAERDRRLEAAREQRKNRRQRVA